MNSNKTMAHLARSQEQEAAAVPDLASDMEMRVVIKEDRDPFLIQFDESYDADNPRCWSNSKKWTVTDVLAATGFNRIMVSTIMAPALTTIAQELNMTQVEAVMSMSAYMLATAFGPLVMGPLSEIYGRSAIMHASNIWFLIWNLVCGFAHTKGLLIAARVLAGFGASAIYALQGGVLGDIWRPEQRGRSLSMYLMIPLLGAAVGPIIGAFMAMRTTWRWMFWSTSAFQAVMILVSIPTYRESYAPVILKHRAARLRKTMGDSRYYTAAEKLDEGRSVLHVLGWSLTRPVRLLVFHPIIQIYAVVSGLSYGLLYIVLSTYADMWVSVYGESVERSGLHYITCAAGEILGAQVTGPLMDYVFARLKKQAGGEIRPEYHIPLMLPGTILAPIGLLIYAWTVHYKVVWVGVDIGFFVFCFFSMTAGQPLQAYVIDAYPEHTSSAMAAAQFVRSLTAFGFPLFAPNMYAALGYGWGNSLLGFGYLVLGIPAFFVIWTYGARLRAMAQSSY